MNDWQIKFKGYDGVLNNTFRVEDGVLRVRYNNWDEWGAQYIHVFYARNVILHFFQNKYS